MQSGEKIICARSPGLIQCAYEFQHPDGLLKSNNIIMKKGILILLSAVSLVSCENGPNARRGTVVGAVGGAAVGGIVGHQSGRGLEGAALGAGIGALGGNMLGAQRDRR